MVGIEKQRETEGEKEKERLRETRMSPAGTIQDLSGNSSVWVSSWKAEVKCLQILHYFYFGISSRKHLLRSFFCWFLYAPSEVCSRWTVGISSLKYWNWTPSNKRSYFILERKPSTALQMWLADICYIWICSHFKCCMTLKMRCCVV